MAKFDVEIEIKIDDSDLKEIVRLRCQNKNCKHSMIWKGFLCCNLKNVMIGSNGTCIDMDITSGEIESE